MRLDYEETRLALNFRDLLERVAVSLEKIAGEDDSFPQDLIARTMSHKMFADDSPGTTQIKFSYDMDEEMWQVEMMRAEKQTWILGPYKIKRKADGYHVEGVHLGTDTSAFTYSADANSRVANAILRNLQEEGEPW